MLEHPRQRRPAGGGRRGSGGHLAGDHGGGRGRRDPGRPGRRGDRHPGWVQRCGDGGTARRDQAPGRGVRHLARGRPVRGQPLRERRRGCPADDRHDRGDRRNGRRGRRGPRPGSGRGARADLDRRVDDGGSPGEPRDLLRRGDGDHVRVLRHPVRRPGAARGSPGRHPQPAPRGARSRPRRSSSARRSPGSSWAWSR